MESATITKVTLRKEKLRSGKLSLYLDHYPPIWNPHIKKMSRREFLGLYLIGNPKDKFELDYNEEIMLKARGIGKMLTHKNVATTQIYAEVVNQKKRDAANSITLK